MMNVMGATRILPVTDVKVEEWRSELVEAVKMAEEADKTPGLDRAVRNSRVMFWKGYVAALETVLANFDED